SYFPLRYKAHLLVPMSILVAIGVNVSQRVGLEKMVGSFTQTRGWSRLFRSALLSLPTAVFLSPLLTFALGLAGVEVDRLFVRLACLSTVLAGVTFVGYRLQSNERIGRLLLIFPLIAGCAYLVISAGFRSVESEPDLMQHIPGTLLLLVLAGSGSY